MAESLYILGDEDRRKFARLIAAAWSDGEARARYGHEPRTMLAEYGIAYPEGVPTPPLPVKPEGEFSVEELEVAAGGGSEAGGCLGSVSTISTLGGCFGCASTYGCGTDVAGA
ncbi:hypothetical protein AB0395_20030 [Streptosporangium sp. NPDC051023]|uniref:hypothetical protein n=1 Tax=Streptosporangium sp. NPDC051023 TaxID=3155410 RepID=UPI003450A31A